MQYEALTRRIIGCAYEVHNTLGGGFLESVYQRSLAVELAVAGLDARFQMPVPVEYKGHAVGDFVADILVEGKVVVELKAIEAIAPVHEVQLVNYLQATGIDIGLLINFSPTGAQVRRKLRVLPPRTSPNPVDPVNPAVLSNTNHQERSS